MFNFKLNKKYLKCLLFLCFWLPAHSSDQNDIIPSQTKQIKVYTDWSDNQSSENYERLRKISEENFDVIEQTIVDRFGQKSERHNSFNIFKTSAFNAFNQNRMNLNFLTDYYSVFIMLLDPKSNFGESSIKSMIKERENVYKFFTPFPIVSQNGISDLDTIYKLPITGKWYLGIPLMETPAFDGQISTAERFFRHDLSHGDFLGDPDLAVKSIAFNFLQKFEKALSDTCQNDQDKEILDVLLFSIIHERGASFEHERGFGLFNLFSISEIPTLDKEGKVLLESAKINTKSPNFLAVHEDFANYFIKKGIMKFSKNRQDKMQEYVEMVHQKIEFYKSKMDQ